MVQYVQSSEHIYINMSIFIERTLKSHIMDNLKPGQVTILYGARRVGKTTLIEQIRKEIHDKKTEFINCDISLDRAKIDTEEYTKLELAVKDKEYLIIDEAQRIPNIGQILKILADNFSGLRILASGSASFDLANKIGEPLTGRKRTLTLYPLSLSETSDQKSTAGVREKLEELLIYGSYPKTYTLPSAQEKTEELHQLVDGYLYKDILELEGIRNAKKIKDLLTLLALQIGSEVSLRELGSNLDMHVTTVSKYLDLLEKTFVVFNIRGFSRNLRKEIHKTSKYYFLDTGIRNALINNFNPLSLRNDTGALWENFCMAQRKIHLEYGRIFANHYFWRTYDQKEIDLVEEREGKLFAYEFKYSNKPAKPPKEFLQTYTNSEYKVITPENISEFIL